VIMASKADKFVWRNAHVQMASLADVSVSWHRAVQYAEVAFEDRHEKREIKQYFTH